MDRTFKSSNEFLNLEDKDLDKYYDSFNDNDIGIIKKIIFFYTTDEEFTKYYKNISNQKAIEKIKELGIFITKHFFALSCLFRESFKSFIISK